MHSSLEGNRDKLHIRTFVLLLAIVAIVTVPGLGHLAIADVGGFESFRNALFDYFKRQNYIPVIVNRGYAIGDVLEVDGVNIYARASRCFPKLKVAKPQPAALADIFETDAVGMNFGLRLKQLLSTNTEADLVKRIRIRFSDVTTVSAARLDLRDALDRKACPEIAPLVDGTLSTVKTDQRLFFVVSEIIYGKREASLQLNKSGDVQARTRRITGQIGDAELSVSASEDGLVILKNPKIVPLALKPVTIPKIISVDSFDLRSEADVNVQWEPLTCSVTSSCGASFDEFSDLIKAIKPKLNSDELE